MTTSPASPLISVAELRAQLGAPGLLVVDCRFDLAKPAWGGEVYAAGHVPGAVFAAMEHDLSAPRRDGSGRHPLPAPADFAALLGRWGVTDSSRIVIYDQGAGAAAARLWWMLRARGHRAVQVLDGGWAAWLAAAAPVDAGLPRIAPTTVSVRPFADAVDAGEVAQGLAAGRFAVIDARAADRYAGRNETIDPVAGHVPGALNHPYTGNLDGNQRWLAPEVLRSRWQQRLGTRAGSDVVMMCGSGITACHNLLALEVAGITGARLYPGSWSEWITDASRPVATGEQS